MSQVPEDLGWGPVVKRYLLSGLTLGLYARRTHGTTDGLTTIGLLFLSVVKAGNRTLAVPVEPAVHLVAMVLVAPGRRNVAADQVSCRRAVRRSLSPKR